MTAPLLCRLGYHRFGAWTPVVIEQSTTPSVKSPRKQDYRVRRCKRCGLEHTDFSPQEGMQLAPPA